MANAWDDGERGDELAADNLGRRWAGTTADGTPVVVRQLTSPQNALRRLRRERGVLLGLRSRHLTPWLDVVLDIEAGDVTFVAPVNSVATVTEELADGLIVTPAVAARLGADVALGLVAIHAAGLVHGGVSTDQVVRDGTPARGGNVPAARLSGVGVRSASLEDGNLPSTTGDVTAVAAIVMQLLRATPEGDAPDGVDETFWALLLELSQDVEGRTARDAASRLAATSSRLTSGSWTASAAPMPAAPELPEPEPAAPMPAASPEPVEPESFEPELPEPEPVEAELPEPEPVEPELPEPEPVEPEPDADWAPESSAPGAPTELPPAAPATAAGASDRPSKRRILVLVFLVIIAIAAVVAGVLLATQKSSSTSANLNPIAGAVTTASTAAATSGAPVSTVTPGVVASTPDLAQPTVTTGGTQPAAPASVLQASDISAAHAKPLAGLAGLDFNSLLRAVYAYCDYYSPPASTRTAHNFVGYSTGVGINLYEDLSTWSGTGAQDLVAGVRQSVAACSVLSATSTSGQVLGTFKISPAGPLQGLPAGQVGLLYQRLDQPEPRVQAVFIPVGNKVLTVLSQGRQQAELGGPLDRAARKAYSRLTGTPG